MNKMSVHEKQLKKIQMFNKAIKSDDSNLATEFLNGSRWDVQKAIQCYHLYLCVKDKDSGNSIVYNRRSEPTHKRRTSEQKLKQKNNRKPPSKRVNSTKALPTSNWAKSDFISSIIEGVSNFVDTNLRDKDGDHTSEKKESYVSEKPKRITFSKMESNEVGETDESGPSKIPIAEYKSQIKESYEEEEEDMKGDEEGSHLTEYQKHTLTTLLSNITEEDGESTSRLTAYFGESLVDDSPTNPFMVEEFSPKKI